MRVGQVLGIRLSGHSLMVDRAGFTPLAANLLVSGNFRERARGLDSLFSKAQIFSQLFFVKSQRMLDTMATKISIGLATYLGEVGWDNVEC